MWNLRTLALTCITGCTSIFAFEPCHFEVRLEHAIASDTARAGDVVRARVLADPVDDGSGACALPPDAAITGRVKRVKRVGFGFRRERASLELEFDTLLADGRRQPIDAQLAEVSNARETVDRKGVVRGVLAADSNLQMQNGLWLRLRPNATMLRRVATGLTGLAGIASNGFGEHPVLAGSIIAARVMLVRMAEPEIRLPAGTELVLQANEAPALPAPAAPPATADGSWAEWVVAQPAGTAKKGDAPAGDLINLALRGSRHDVESAFAAAGWLPTDPLNKKNALRLFQAHSRKGPYPTAPVSPLYYEGRLPDAVFQKSFNTVAKRHHIRLWQVPNGPGGQPLWLGAATHDVGLKIDRKTIANHRIDPEIDGERRKVVRDLADARCLAGPVQLVERPGVRGGVTDGHEVITDGRVAVLRVNESGCARPVQAAAGQFRQRSLFCRFVRRTVLETRHYLLRSNVYYFGYRLASKFRSPRTLHHL